MALLIIEVLLGFFLLPMIM